MLKNICLSLMTVALSALPSMAKVSYPYEFAPSTGIVAETEIPFRKEVCLNGLWQFQPVALPSDYRQGAGKAPQLPLPRTDGWDKTPIKIPSPWNVNAFGYNGLEGPDHRNYPSYPKEWNDALMGWLRKEITVPADWKGEDIVLYFEAIAGDAEVYVNGQKVGENFEMFLPSQYDITDYVTPGDKAEIMVGVRSQKLFEDNSTTGRRIIPAGSMWGYLINGIWQDVYLLAKPKVRVEDIYIKPLVNENRIEVDLTLANSTSAAATVNIGGDIKEWINKCGTDVNSAPVPASKDGATVLNLPKTSVKVPADGEITATFSIPVDGELDFWTPEHPNLYVMDINLDSRKQTVDKKRQRFGWRQWTISKDKYLLNGKEIKLKSDSWHFMGVPQMTRRYAWAWFKAIKDMNGNTVRPHAQVYPRFYLDLADEMGICVLDETANWASDGGPKFDSDHFWNASKEHLRRFVKRDRNHPAVFGWSISNENKPVILYVYNRPELLEPQKQAWKEWRDIVMELDPTRPWISSDGEEDGEGILPVTVGHYGDDNAMTSWKKIGKPWGVGEHSMAYYGTPEQVSVYNGERAYESAEGRMEGIANECYNLIRKEREAGATFSTIFNMVWYGLQPLPFGKADITVTPDMSDGIYFPAYVEGKPGMQPERMGPYSSTLNPGYDPALPLYRTWPLFHALAAANAPAGAAPCQWATADKHKNTLPEIFVPKYAELMYVGGDVVRNIFESHGVSFVKKVKNPAKAMIIVDASAAIADREMAEVQKLMSKGADVWLWGITPVSVASFADVLPANLEVTELRRSSFIPTGQGWTKGMNNSDFYFCAIQSNDASAYTLSGDFVEQGQVMLNACRTDWRKWNNRPEELKTAALLRSENECTAPLAVMAAYYDGDNTVVVSTMSDYANSEKGYNALAGMLHNAGIPVSDRELDPSVMFFLNNGQLTFPSATKDKFENGRLTLYVYSPRHLDDLLIEPNMPKLTLRAKNAGKLIIGGNEKAAARTDGDFTVYEELPLRQGWNEVAIELRDGKSGNDFAGSFSCGNNDKFVGEIRAKFSEQ